jgi:hypothetical protein
VRLKFVTTKTIDRGLPFPMTALFAGETIARVGGGGAARTLAAGNPETRSSPTAVRRSATVRAFNNSSPLWDPHKALRRNFAEDSARRINLASEDDPTSLLARVAISLDSLSSGF